MSTRPTTGRLTPAPHPGSARRRARSVGWGRQAAFGVAALMAFNGAALLATPSAQAFCGFYVSGADAKLYNNATQVVLMREGERTVLSMQNNYQGPPEDFAMVVPVPVVLSEESVKTLPASLFEDVDRMASPRLVEYWEVDPCAPDRLERFRTMAVPTSDMMVEESAVEEKGDYGVTVEAEFAVGEYDVVILSAKESNGLDRWLRDNKYQIPDEAAPALQPYIDQGLYFFVAKVNAKKINFNDGQATLSPLRFHYDSPQFSLPVRLGLLNANGPQDLIVHILARGQRYQVVNKKNVTIPTNIGVSPDAKDRFGEFYAALFDRTLEKNPGAVVTEYAWDAGTCDPCPGPVLQPEHFATLGADVMPNPNPWGFVLTRLHTRYTKDNPTDDLVFAAAPPIVGGREIYAKDHELEHGATPSGFNNFQGRYAIRHAWTGPINCESPIRGRWGGPPAGSVDADQADAPTVAEDTAFAPRGELKLANFVTTAIPELDVSAATLEDVPNTEPLPVPAKPGEGGCASCAVADGDSKGPLIWFGLLALVALGVRSRRP